MINSIEWYAGFFDGDGCVDIYELPPRPNVTINPTYHLMVKVAITNQEPILLFRDKFGGRVSQRLPKKGNRKEMFTWVTTNRKELLNFSYQLTPYLILKYGQVENLAKFIDSTHPNKKGELELKNRLYLLFRRSRNEIRPIIPELLSPPYLGGFFDAEGSIVVHQNAYIYPQITVALYERPIIEAITAKFGGNILHSMGYNFIGWTLSSKPLIKEFLSVIRPFSILKGNKIDKALEYATSKDLRGNKYWWGGGSLSASTKDRDERSKLISSFGKNKQ